MHQMTFKSIKVLTGVAGSDTVFLEPICITPYPILGYQPLMKMDVQAGYGVEWVRQAFNCEPDEVIDLNKPKNGT